VYLHKGLYLDAVRHYKKAIDIKLEATATRYNLGLAYQELGETDSAQSTFLELIKIAPNYWDAYYQLSLILIAEGDKENAKVFLETLLKKNPDYEKRAEVESKLSQL